MWIFYVHSSIQSLLISFILRQCTKHFTAQILPLNLQLLASNVFTAATGDSFGSYKSRTLPSKCLKYLKTDTSSISWPHFLHCWNKIFLVFRLLRFSCALQRPIFLLTHYPVMVLAEIIVPFSRFQAGYIRIDGSVPSSERIQLVHKFQNDPETRVAVLSIQAAGQVVNQNKNSNDWSWVTHNIQRFRVQKNIQWL